VIHGVLRTADGFMNYMTIEYCHVVCTSYRPTRLLSTTTQILNREHNSPSEHGLLQQTSIKRKNPIQHEGASITASGHAPTGGKYKKLLCVVNKFSMGKGTVETGTKK
jgi:hypothetical protein